MNRTAKRAAAALGILLGLAVLALLGYVGYLQGQYYRIPDKTELEVTGPRTELLATGTPYTAVSCNLGFGAYGPDYSFFMDTGEMDDGTPTGGCTVGRKAGKRCSPTWAPPWTP